MIKELILLAAITANKNISSPDQSHLIGFKNGNITTATDAQTDACVAAFLDGQLAEIFAGEMFQITEVFYQEYERDVCVELAQLPGTNESYCKKYGPMQKVTAQISRMRSELTQRFLQLVCFATEPDPEAADRLRHQNLGPYFD